MLYNKQNIKSTIINKKADLMLMRRATASV